MATIIQASGVKVELHKTLASALPSITAVTLAAPPVATSVAHGLATGDYVLFTVPSGMTKLDKQAAKVTVLTADTFSLAGLDATNFAAWITAAGNTAQKITAWDSADNITDWTLNEGTPNKQTVTTIHDTAVQEVFGLDPVLEGTMSILSNPASAWVLNLRTASVSHAVAVQRLTLQNGEVILVSSYMAGGRGVTLKAGEVSTGSVSFSAIHDPLYY